MKDMLTYWKWNEKVHKVLLKNAESNILIAEEGLELKKNSSQEIKIMIGSDKQWEEMIKSFKESKESAKKALISIQAQIRFYENLLNISQNQ